MHYSVETVRGHANDDDWNAVQSSLPSKNRPISAKVFLENAVAKDDGPLRLFALVITDLKAAACGWRKAKNVEEIVGDKLKIDPTGRPIRFL